MHQGVCKRQLIQTFLCKILKMVITQVTLQKKVALFIIRVQNLMLVFKQYIRTLPQRNQTQHQPQLMVRDS